MRSRAAIFLAVIFLATPALVALADFNPGNLISDAAFSDTQTFGGAAGIQQFLVAKGSVLANTDPTFLLELKEPQESLIKSALNDPEPNLPRLRTAAELIWDASQESGLNPQVIVVTLEKEQSLIDGTFSDPSSLQGALDFAMGFGCPDSGGCGALYSGFYYQLFGNLDAQGNRYLGAPESLMRSFNTPNGRGPMVDVSSNAFGSPLIRVSNVGDTINIQNTQGSAEQRSSCAGSDAFQPRDRRTVPLHAARVQRQLQFLEVLHRVVQVPQWHNSAQRLRRVHS